VLEAEAGATDPMRPRLDGDALSEEDRRAERDRRLGEDQPLDSTRLTLERLAGRSRPPPDPSRLDVGQVRRVVDMAHRVGVGKANLDRDPMAEIAVEIAPVRLSVRADPIAAGRARHGVTSR